MSDIPKPVCDAVDFRDQQKCVRCGIWIAYGGSRHHRQRRRDGGHLVVNVILLCGSGTTGCHGWAHNHPAAARLEGIIVLSSVEDVAEIPLLVYSDFERPCYVTLTEDGQRVPMDATEAQRRLALAA